jgi:hypothetical protein
MRRWKRALAGYNCTVDLSDGNPPRACKIKNLSVGGACLIGLDPSDVPSPLVVRFWDRGKVKRTCRVVWTDARHLGVEFVGRRR